MKKDNFPYKIQRNVKCMNITKATTIKTGTGLRKTDWDGGSN